jgi:hypothetical protein
LFFSAIVAGVERRAPRDRSVNLRDAPGFASLHPGYAVETYSAAVTGAFAPAP